MGVSRKETFKVINISSCGYTLPKKLRESIFGRK